MTPSRASATGRRAAVAALLWSALVALLLTVPQRGLPEVGWLPAPVAAGADKLVHGVLFAVHAALVAGAAGAGAGPRLARARPRTVAAAVSIGYAFLLEVVQIPLPTRSWEWLDLGAGAAGAVLALLWRG